VAQERSRFNRRKKNQDRLKEKSMPAQCDFGSASASCIGRDRGVVRRAVEET